MAGRPLTRARKFAEWEDRLWQLKEGLWEMKPPSRPISQQREDAPDLWGGMVALLEYTMDTASELRFQLEDKAGLDAEALQAERERARGLWDDEAADGASDEATAENATTASRPRPKNKSPAWRVRERREQGPLGGLPLA